MSLWGEARKRLKRLYYDPNEEIPEPLRGTRSQGIIEDVRADRTLGPSEPRVQPHGFFGALVQSEKERGGVPPARAAAPVPQHVPHPMMSDEGLASAKTIGEFHDLAPLKATSEQIAKAEAAVRKREEELRRKRKKGGS